MLKHFSKQLSAQVHIEGKRFTDKKMSIFRKGLIHDFSQKC